MTDPIPAEPRETEPGEVATRLVTTTRTGDTAPLREDYLTTLTGASS